MKKMNMLPFKMRDGKERVHSIRLTDAEFPSLHKLGPLRHALSREDATCETCLFAASTLVDPTLIGASLSPYLQCCGRMRLPEPSHG